MTMVSLELSIAGGWWLDCAEGARFGSFVEEKQAISFA